jgi:hypothetical protein
LNLFNRKGNKYKKRGELKPRSEKERKKVEWSRKSNGVQSCGLGEGRREVYTKNIV